MRPCPNNNFSFLKNIEIGNDSRLSSVGGAVRPDPPSEWIDGCEVMTDQALYKHAKRFCRYKGFRDMSSKVRQDDSGE